MIVERSALELNPIVILNIRVKRWRTPERNPIAILDVMTKRWRTPELNRLTRWLTGSVNPLFCDIMKTEKVYQSKQELQKWQ